VTHAIKAVCFDLDGTLARYGGGFRAYMALLRHELMADGCELDRFAATLEEEIGRDGPLTLETALRRTLARCEMRPPSDLRELARGAVRSYADDVRPLPGAAALLDRLSGAGVPTALVSNGPVDLQRAALARLGFERHFRAVLVSGDPDVGARKPAQRIFSLACTGLESLPAETLMVGDTPDGDIGGALAYGMQAVLLGDAGEAERLGVPAAADLAELEVVLQERLGG